MFTAIYIEFFSLHQIDLKLTTLFILSTFTSISPSVRLTGRSAENASKSMSGWL